MSVGAARAWLGLSLIAVGAGCGGGSGAQGGERQPCFPNGTCNAGLTCASKVCVDLGSVDAGGAGGGAGAAGTTGTGGTTGAGGIGGTTGAGGTGGTAGAGAAGGAIGAGGRGGAGGTGGVSGQGGTTSCGTVARPSSNLPPDILLLQDASGSMNDDATNQSCGTAGCGLNSKWSLMTAAIQQVIAQTETDVNWGLKLFPETSSACGVFPTVAVSIAPMNAAPIIAAIAGRTAANGNVVNGGSTPTRAAETAAVNYLSTLADPNSKYIVLATDGQPNCPPSGNQNIDDSPAAIAAITAARTAGFPTFVVGISPGGDIPGAILDQMAVEGGYPQVGQPTQYYPVTSTADFAAVLRMLVTTANTGTFSVPPPPTSDGTTSRGDIGVVATTAGGATMDLVQNGNTGWTYADATQTSIILHGTACDQWKARTITTVTIVFHCLVH